MEWQRYKALAEAAPSASERSWWSGKALQIIGDDHNEAANLQQACLHARQTFLSPRVLGMVKMDEHALWAEVMREGWKIEDFITPAGTLNWLRLTSAEMLGMDPAKGGAEKVIVSDDDDFLRAAPFLRKVSLFVHRSWLAGMPPSRFAELYKDRFSIAARPEVALSSF
jgi:hypothetical protein